MDSCACNSSDSRRGYRSTPCLTHGKQTGAWLTRSESSPHSARSRVALRGPKLGLMIDWSIPVIRYITLQVPMSELATDPWKEHRRRKSRFLVVFVGLPLWVLALVLVLVVLHTINLPAVAIVLFVSFWPLYLVALAYTYCRFALWPCPRCAQSFHVRHYWDPYMYWSSWHCVHCRFPMPDSEG
jgi:hypothetical protein